MIAHPQKIVDVCKYNYLYCLYTYWVTVEIMLVLDLRRCSVAYGLFIIAGPYFVHELTRVYSVAVEVLMSLVTHDVCFCWRQLLVPVIMFPFPPSLILFCCVTYPSHPCVGVSRFRICISS